MCEREREVSSLLAPLLLSAPKPDGRGIERASSLNVDGPSRLHEDDGSLSVS